MTAPLPRGDEDPLHQCMWMWCHEYVCVDVVWQDVRVCTEIEMRHWLTFRIRSAVIAIIVSVCVVVVLGAAGGVLLWLYKSMRTNCSCSLSLSLSLL